MADKISVSTPLVVLHGDEMAQIAFDRILEQFVHKNLDIPLVEINLSAENRLLSNGQVVVDAIEEFLFLLAVGSYSFAFRQVMLTTTVRFLTCPLFCVCVGAEI